MTRCHYGSTFMVAVVAFAWGIIIYSQSLLKMRSDLALVGFAGMVIGAVLLHFGTYVVEDNKGTLNKGA